MYVEPSTQIKSKELGEAAHQANSSDGPPDGKESVIHGTLNTAVHAFDDIPQVEEAGLPEGIQSEAVPQPQVSETFRYEKQNSVEQSRSEAVPPSEEELSSIDEKNSKTRNADITRLSTQGDESNPEPDGRMNRIKSPSHEQDASTVPERYPIATLAPKSSSPPGH